MRVAAGIVVDETGFKVLSETDVETRWLACGPQDVDVEEAGLHRAPCILRSPKAGVF